MDLAARRTVIRRLSSICLLASATLLACGPTYRPTDPAATPPAAPPGALPGDTSPPAVDDSIDNERPGTLRYTFRMDTPANDKFAFYDDELHIYARPFDDNISIKIQGREQNFIRIHWDECEFVDILGRRYKVVPPEYDLIDATRGMPPTDVQVGTIYVGRLKLLDPTDLQAIQRLGGKPSPIVPPDAGTAEQVRGQMFELTIVLDMNGARRSYPFSFEIRDAYYRR